VSRPGHRHGYGLRPGLALGFRLDTWLQVYLYLCCCCCMYFKLNLQTCDCDSYCCMPTKFCILSRTNFLVYNYFSIFCARPSAPSHFFPSPLLLLLQLQLLLHFVGLFNKLNADFLLFAISLGLHYHSFPFSDSHI